MRTRRAGLVMIAALGLVAVAGCGGAGNGGDSGQGKVASKGGTLHVLSPLDLEHLDPARNYVTSSEDVGRLIYRTLTTFAAAPGQAGGRIVPDLATDLGRSSNGARTWTFTLKAGVKYEDGRPISSKDIKYGVERTFEADLPEGPPYARTWLVGGDAYKGPSKDKSGIASIETPDDRTIVFKLNRPVADFGSAVSLPMFAPVPADKDSGVRYDARPFSSGPYKIAEYELKKELTLVRNTYWSPATDSVRKALPDKIVIDLNLDPAVIDQRLIAGQGQDANAVEFEPLTPASVGPVMGNPALRQRLITGDSINTRYLSINTKHKPLDDVRVRQAIEYALDKDALRTARGGPIAGDIAKTLLPPSTPGFAPDNPYPSPDDKGDPAKAKALLAEAGHASGLTLTLDAPATTTGKAQAEAVQASLARVGITVHINAIASSAFYSTVGNTSQEHDLVIAGWSPDWPGASTYLPIVFDGRQITAQGNNNYAQYSSAKVNARLDEIAKMNDSKAAADAYGQLAKDIMQDAPVVPFLWDKAAILVGPNVTGAYGHIAYVGRLDLVSLGLRK